MKNTYSPASISILGRLLLVAIFLFSAAGKIPNFASVAADMKKHDVPYPEVLLVGAIVFLIVGGISVLVGYKARAGAALLLIFLGLATYFYHDFWTVRPTDAMWVSSVDASDKLSIMGNELISFMKNAALAGAMLLIIANGPGAGSIDNLLCAQCHEKQG